jgi:single-stranded DNA-binding protein
MFRFTAQGRIGKIEELGRKTLKISIAADRLVEGRDGQFTKTEWIRCVSFDETLNAEMLTQLEKGDSVSFEGRIVPTVWLKGEQKIYDNTFEITRYQRLSRPKAKSAPKKADETAEAA